MADYFKRLIDDNRSNAPTEKGELYDMALDNWHPEMDDKQLSLVFDKGASVNIFLRPSDKITKRAGNASYIENYELKNHLREGERYASFTDGHHVTEADSIKGLTSGYRSYYSYSNIGPGFFNFSTLPVDGKTKSNLQIMNKVRYEEMHWVVKDDYDLIFDGETFEKNVEIINAIQAGKNFRIALTLADNRQFRLDVDLLFYYPSDHNCYGYTKSYFMPTSLAYPQKMHEACLQNFLDENRQYPAELSLPFMEDAIPTLFHFYADGHYKYIINDALSEKIAYKNIKIFASKS